MHCLTPSLQIVFKVIGSTALHRPCETDASPSTSTSNAEALTLCYPAFYNNLLFRTSAGIPCVLKNYSMTLFSLKGYMAATPSASSLKDIAGLYSRPATHVRAIDDPVNNGVSQD